MSTKTSIICIVLLFACIGVCKWHHSLDNDFHTTVIEGDLYIMQALAERIEERDAYITRLEAYIISQWEAQDDESGDVQPTDTSVPTDAPGGSS